MSSLPAVSVIIPSHNRPELVLRAIATVEAQVNVDYEIIVVDDGSAVPVSTLVDATRVTVLRNEQAAGVSRARNRGVAAARAPWVAFLDDDDVWAPNKLEMQLEETIASGARWSHTGTIALDGDMRMRWVGLAGSQWSHAQYLRAGNFVGTPSCVMASKAFLDELGGFDDRISIMADWDLWLRMADVEPGYAVQTALIGYVTHSGSMHRGGVKPILRELSYVKAKHRAVGRIESAGIWKWIGETKRDSGFRFAAVPWYWASALWGRNYDTFTIGVQCLLPRGLRRTVAGLGVAPSWIRQWQPTTPVDSPRP